MHGQPQSYSHVISTYKSLDVFSLFISFIRTLEIDLLSQSTPCGRNLIIIIYLSRSP